ncbi:hypothetical protein AAA799O18_00354 [Marine Group I thaumarchaeote SCGC AAA799-O18]|nr:hypothetical protein AAA799O18_00354 [Marine Group I thaumarchaeote SCGC AAA799-O18]
MGILDSIRDWNDRRKENEYERERRKEELRKERTKINKLLNKFTVKHLKDFCLEYIGSSPADELITDEEDEEFDDEDEQGKVGKAITYGKKFTHKFQDKGEKHDRTLYVEFIWRKLMSGVIEQDQINDFSLKKRIVPRNYFGVKSDAKEDKKEFSTILSIIQSDFEPERITGKDKEDKFQSQLTVFLKAKFPDKKIDREVVLQNGDRVDIVIDDKFALELKVPIDRIYLRNLTAQLEEYLEEYDFLGVVIADITEEQEENEEEPMTQNINEYVDRFKSKFGVQSVVLPIKFKGSK